MSEEERRTSTEDVLSEPWDEVQDDVRALARGLSEVVSRAWRGEDTQAQLETVKSEFNTLVADIERAGEVAASSPQRKRAEAQIRQAADSAEKAVNSAWDDARPQMLSALETLDRELRSVIDDLRSVESPADDTEDT